MAKCGNINPDTERVCGQDSDSPWHTRFCSEECEDRFNREELAEIGITPEMLKEALDGYYECKDMIDEAQPTDVESE